MKNSSKKCRGFTLIEVIISMSLIAIISVGIYNGYLFLIRQTKDGQVKQRSSLIGKQVSEDIKSASGQKDIILNGDVIQLTDNIEFTKDADNYSCTQIFDKDGNETSDINYEYKAEVKITPKKSKALDDSEESVSINDIESDNSETDILRVCVIKDGSGKAMPIDEEVQSSEITSDDINHDIVADIKIAKDFDDDYIGYISIDGNDLEYEFKEKNMQINLDLRYCKDNIKINVDNISKKPLNLCILNNKNTDVENVKGVLNEYYRLEGKGKIGLLYDVNIEVFNKKNETDPLFETNFVQNIDIK